jgi:hypothetical protein
MKLKKEYVYPPTGRADSKNRQIWRLIPTDSEKLIIEERNTSTKEVFFNCIDINTGQIIINDYQFDEKYWIGIESVANDIIYFHKFEKPDMPTHSGIIAFDIRSQKIIWQTQVYSFLFVFEEKIYCYRSTFEGKHFFVLNSYTGEMIEDLGENFVQVNSLKEKAFNSFYFENYIFPEPFNSNDPSIQNFITDFKKQHTIVGRIEYINTGDAFLFNFHEVLPDGNLQNRFLAIDIFTKKIIFEEILNSSSKVFIPDSFFVKEKLLFLLKEKDSLIVCSFNY